MEIKIIKTNNWEANERDRKGREVRVNITSNANDQEESKDLGVKEADLSKTNSDQVVGRDRRTKIKRRIKQTKTTEKETQRKVEDNREEVREVVAGKGEINLLPEVPKEEVAEVKVKIETKAGVKNKDLEVQEVLANLDKAKKLWL